MVEQYTGLDIHDIEVYEGDILNTKAARWEVTFMDGCFVGRVIWSAVFKIGETCPLKDIIDHAIPLGNRHDNSDLLTV